ncbi:BTAD domain-containing putative transcriptional regulator [Nonomuraea sp. NPDC050536]|uniref:AfsR/SARP family transcriptional regulator n=1 Tax=Nonomuraea sp. NPDC050536 TaxID=3364366 RepID=UPI0037C9F44C
MTSGVWVGILGPAQARHDGVELDLGAPRQRALLACLALAEGRPVTLDQLIEALWEDDPAPTVTPMVRSYVSRLRKVLGHERLVRLGGGYALREVGTDLAEFHALAAQGQHRRALALWRGDAVPELTGRYGEAQRTRLEDLRLSATEAACERELADGAADGLIAELLDLVARSPLRERPRGLLMRAYAAAGRREEALAVYAGFQQLLAEELGLDPGPELATLHQSLLAGAGPRPARLVAGPAQLPPDISDFTGRATQVDELLTELRTERERAPVVSVVSGIGGVGKTTLALHVAHAVRRDFPDGQLYVDLQGAGPAPADPAAALTAFLHALGVGDQDIPDAPQERSALFRSLVSGRRMLVVLDNAADAAQVTPLLPGDHGCGVLVTSRVRLHGLDGARVLDLTVLDGDEAVALLTKIIGPERVAAEPEQARRLAELCGHLPLAVRVAGARLASRSSWTIASMVGRLAGERDRLRALRVLNLAVESSFELSYRQLDPGCARAFRLVAVPDSEDLSLSSAAALLDLDEVEAEQLLENLVDLSLLESPAAGRYRFHDLLKVYARQQADDERERALARLVVHLLATLQSACEVWRLALYWAAPRVRGGLPFAGTAEADRWLAAELAGIWPVVAQSGDAVAVRLLRLLEERVDRMVHHGEFRRTAEAVKQSAEARGDLETATGAACVLGSVFFTLGDRAQAEPVLRAAAGHARDRILLSEITTLLALVIASRGDYPAAAETALAAVEAGRGSGDPAAEARALTNLAQIQLRTGQAEEALGHITAAVELVRPIKTVDFEVSIMGDVLSVLERHAEAIRCYTEALEAHRAQGLVQMSVEDLVRLADAHRRTGDLEQALAHADEGLALSREIEDPINEAHALLSRGQALVELGKPDEGRECLRQSLALYDGLDITSPRLERIRESLTRHAD